MSANAMSATPETGADLHKSGETALSDGVCVDSIIKYKTHTQSGTVMARVKEDGGKSCVKASTIKKKKTPEVQSSINQVSAT